MADIFISYAKDDRATIDALSEDLEKLGYSHWYDAGLLPGHSWRQRIRSEIEKAAVIVVLWSPHSVNSKFVLDEVDKAGKLEKPVIPLRMKGFDTANLPLEHGETQACLVSNIDAIKRALEELGVKTRLAPQTPTAPPGKGLTAQTIFRSAVPELTLIDRTASNEGKKVTTALEMSGLCVRLCGPTRSGKTVLIDQVMADRNAFYLSGGVITDLASFHDYLAVQLDPPLAVPANEAMLMTKVLAAKRPIIVDDYHRINPQTRQALIKRMQTFVDADLLVVLVSWTDVDGERIEKDPGIGGRSEHVQMSLWTEADIQQIGQIGFTEGLKVKISPQTLAAITKQSFRNPSLMQQYCYAVAEKCGVLKPQTTPKTVSMSADDLHATFVAACNQTRRNFEGWIERPNDEKHDLKTGRRTSIFGIILLAVAKMEPIHTMTTATLARNMKDKLANSEWVTGPIAENAVRDFIKRLEGNTHRHTAIDFANGKLHIHPFFKRYLLWDFLPSKGYPYPDLTGYSDEK